MSRRIERKTMDKEFPAHEIVARGGKHLEAFIEAARQEETCWTTWKSVAPYLTKKPRKRWSHQLYGRGPFLAAPPTATRTKALATSKQRHG